MNVRRSDGGRMWPWAVVPLFLVVVFVLWPLGVLVWRGFSVHGAPSGVTAAALIRASQYRDSLAFTVGQATVATLVALLVGVPAGWALARARFPGVWIARVIVSLPLVLPGAVTAIAFERLLREGGRIAWLVDKAADVETSQAVRHAAAIVGTSGFVGIPVVAFMVAQAWARVDPRISEAAMLLGAGRMRRFISPTLSSLVPSLVAAAAIAFALAFTAFTTALILGGGNGYADTVELSTYRLAQEGNAASASVLALVRVGVTGLLLLVAAWCWRERPAGPSPSLTYRHPSGQSLVAILLLLRVAAIALVPVAVLVRDALAAGSAPFLGLRSDAGAFDAARDSLMLGGAAAIVAVAAGTPAGIALARGRGLGGWMVRVMVVAPLAMGGIALGIGYPATLGAMRSGIGRLPFCLLAAHAALGFPFVALAVAWTAGRVDPRVVEVARTLGASRLRAWLHLVLPRLVRGVMIGGFAAFIVSLGESGAALPLQRPPFVTLPVAIIRSWTRGDANGTAEALVLSTVLAALCAAALLVIERVGYRQAGAS